MTDKITQEIQNDIVATLTPTRTITRIENSGRTLTIHFMPLLDVSARKVLDAEYAVTSKYCNAPYDLYSDNDAYRFRVSCN